MNTQITAREVDGQPDSETGMPAGYQDVQARMIWREDRGRLHADWIFGRPLTPAGELWRRPASGPIWPRRSPESPPTDSRTPWNRLGILLSRE